MWSVWDHEKDILMYQQQEVMSHGSWQRTWISLKDRSWRLAQTNFVKALPEIIRIRLNTRAACTHLFLPCSTSQTTKSAFCLNTSGTSPRRANIGGGAAHPHLWEASLRSVTPSSTCLRQGMRFDSLCPGQLTREESFEDPDSASPPQGSQPTLCRALVCRTVSSLHAPLLQSQMRSPWTVPNQACMYPPHAVPLLWFFQWNSIEDQQWAKYCAMHCVQSS